MIASRNLSPPPSVAAEVSLSYGSSELHVHPMASTWKGKNRNRNKKRFSDEQIRLLESMFEAGSRPELQMKQQLAYELGLQPRQVAIWFQNRRARNKSKQIEQEYNALKSSYDNLASKYETLKKENQCLLIQLQRLKHPMRTQQGIRNPGKGKNGEGIVEEYDIKETNNEAEEKTDPLQCNDHEMPLPLRDYSSDNVEYHCEEPGILNMAGLVPDGTLTSPRNWCSLESSFECSCALDHPSCSTQWWDH